MKTTEKNVADLSETQRLDQIISRRRAFMTLGGTALAGLVFSGSAKAQAAAVTDTDILNFALNLEYLEAEYYTIATSGKTIDDPAFGIGTGPSPGPITIKGNSVASAVVAFSNPSIRSYALETAAEERKHVTFLRQALGSAAVAQPALDLLNSFNGLAAFATIGPAFDPFVNDLTFLLGSYIFEDVGVTAYHGAAGLLTDSGHLTAAAGLLGAEAYHAGLVRTVLFGIGESEPAPSTTFAITTKISNARAKLDGTASDDVPVNGIVTTSVGPSATIVNADANTIAFARTTAQVLSIVYAGGTGKGGFFPAGLNGTIK